MNLTLLGIVGGLLVLVFLLLSMPVGFSLALVGTAGFALVIHNPEGASHLLVSVFYENFCKYDLSVIPLFILMGQIAFHAGFSRNLFDAAYAWFGRLPGGLGVATVGACSAFSAICGSGPATAATMTSVIMPEIRRHHYNLPLGAGLIAASGSLGIGVPPSVVFIVYAIMTNLSPVRLFTAGILPCILVILAFGAYTLFICWRKPELGPPATHVFTWKERFRSLLGCIDPMVLFIVVMGGLILGWFTPTESAAIGAGGVLLLAAIRRKLTWKMLCQSLQESVRISCMVMIIVAGALVLGRFLAVTRIPQQLADVLTGLAVPWWVTIGLILIFFAISGCFVDALALVLLTIPIFYPVIRSLHFDPVLFGILVVQIVQLGVITPPVGVNVYVVS